MSTYATLDDLKAFAPQLDPDASDELLQAALDNAEQDIDSAVGYVMNPDLTASQKFNLTYLDDNQKLRLNRATCAQAEYRLYRGENFFIEGTQKEVTGRDSRLSGPLPRIGPKASTELTRGGLYRLTSRNRATNAPLPNQNFEDWIP